MGLFDYVSDNGETYHVRMDASNAAAVGASAAATGEVADKPGRLKPRYLLAKDTTSGRERRITCPDPTDGTWTGTSTTITLVDSHVFPSAAVSYGISGRIGEKRYG
jgi:hypothetical protein